MHFQAHARAGRWQEAARHLGAFASSITEIDPSDLTEVSGNLIPAAAAIVRSGRSDDYEAFRRLLVRRFSATRHVAVAEQVMKSCLLTPAAPGTLAGLEPLEGLVKESCAQPGPPADAYMHAWRCFCLGLLEYRRVNYEQALPWLDRALATPNTNDAREAATRMARAMAFIQLGHRDRADIEARRADALLEIHQGTATSPTPPEYAAEGFHGYWFDWVINQILRDELRRTGQVDSASPAP